MKETTPSVDKKEKFKAFLKTKPLRVAINSVKKYTFGFRTGVSFQEAFDKDSETTLKDATMGSIMDTAKSTGKIYASKTMFSVMKLAFVESAVGSFLLSSTLVVTIRGGLALFMAAVSKTTLGMLFASLSTTLTITFTGVATTLLTIFAGSQLGRLVSSTTLGSMVLSLCWKLIGIVASVIPILLGSVLLGYMYQFYQKTYGALKKITGDVLEESQEDSLEQGISGEEDGGIL